VDFGKVVRMQNGSASRSGLVVVDRGRCWSSAWNDVGICRCRCWRSADSGCLRLAAALEIVWMGRVDFEGVITIETIKCCLAAKKTKVRLDEGIWAAVYFAYAYS
jgi:hypothetical protein